VGTKWTESNLLFHAKESQVVQSREELASRLTELAQNPGSPKDAQLLAEAALWIMSELGHVKAVSHNALSTAQSADAKAGHV
jgi:hypothetical protein